RPPAATERRAAGHARPACHRGGGPTRCRVARRGPPVERLPAYVWHRWRNEMSGESMGNGPDPNPDPMKLFDLEIPLPSHRTAVQHVLSSMAVTLGFGLGGWLLDAPLHREGAIA